MRSEDMMYGAIIRGDVEAVQRILHEDSSVLTVFAVNKTWLHWAAEMGDIEIMSTLLETGLPVDSLTSDGPRTPLHAAACQAKFEACKWLIEHGADVNHGTGAMAAPLFSAIYGNSLEIVKLFVENGAIVDKSKDDVITYSEKYGTPEIVDFLKRN